jgi:hypothetical protein
LWRLKIKDKRRTARTAPELPVPANLHLGKRDHFAELARDVVQQKPDLIFAVGSFLGRQFKSETTTIPIVLVTSDPVAFGFAASLARPGGNITGVSVDAGLEIWRKRVALLKEAVPTLSRVASLLRVRGLMLPMAGCCERRPSKWAYRSSVHC